MCEGSLLDGRSTFTLTKTGIRTLRRAASSRGDTEKTFYTGQNLHQLCRRNYTNKKLIRRLLKKKQVTESSSRLSLRSMNPSFNFSTDCLFCGKAVNEHKRNDSVFQMKPETRAKLELYCLQRGIDNKWGKDVYSRKQYAQGRNVPSAYDSTANIEMNKQGRSIDSKRQEAFKKLTDLMKNEKACDDLLTVEDLCEKTREFLDGSEPYCQKHMKTKLKEVFGPEIIITLQHGRKSVIMFQQRAEDILSEFWKARKTDQTSVYR